MWVERNRLLPYFSKVGLFVLNKGTFHVQLCSLINSRAHPCIAMWKNTTNLNKFSCLRQFQRLPCSIVFYLPLTGCSFLLNVINGFFVAITSWLYIWGLVVRMEPCCVLVSWYPFLLLRQEVQSWEILKHDGGSNVLYLKQKSQLTAVKR